MNRLYALIVSAGCLSAAAGCGSPPAEAKAAASRDEARAALDRQAGSPLPPPAPSRPSSPPDDPALDAHPAVQQATYNSRAVTDSQARIVALYETAVRPALGRTRLVKAWDAPDADLPALAAAARLLREMGELVVRADDAFKALADAHRKALDRAPAGYQVLAAHLREKAADQEFPLLRERYGMLAAHAEAQAAQVAEVRDGFRQLERDVTGAMRFTRATVDFLRDLELTLALAPTADAGELRGHYQDHLRLYVRAYGQFDLVFVTWAAAVGSRPLPPRPTDPPPPADPSRGGADRLAAATGRAATDPDAWGADAAAHYGEWFVRAVRDARAESESLTRRMAEYTSATIPAPLRAELEQFLRRAGHLNGLRLAAVSPAGVIALDDRDVPPPGTHLPVLRDNSREFVAVVRVGGELGGGRIATTVVRGALRPGDRVLRPPPGDTGSKVAAAAGGGGVR